ncbi:MAG: tRNA pseudouridine(55) synthase TruB [Defluviitaleaceae bacterium]|nr:tRNA pseudouridine(55) synthase TruB [Defluviitaleaceae bacterium]
MKYNETAAVSGVVNLAKERGYTSHDAVAAVRRIFGGAKAGHAGTLDPQAEGVLPICLGKATKIVDYIGGESKSYRGVLVLGKVTDTEDLTGKTLRETGFAWDARAIEEAVRSFEGEISQIPPMYSAVKVDGQKLYQMARRGIEIERKPRRITIHGIKIAEMNPAEKTVTIDVDCSKGTYIRTLFADIGERLGCGGCMGALTRTRVGGYRLADAVTVGRLREMAQNGGLEAAVAPVESALPYPIITALPEAEKKLRNGNAIRPDLCEAGGVGVEQGRTYFVRVNGLTVGLFEAAADESGLLLRPKVMLL